MGNGIYMPGDGTCVGSYVLVDDVVRGHILAALHGRPGQSLCPGRREPHIQSSFLIPWPRSRAGATGSLPLPVGLMVAAAKVNGVAGRSHRNTSHDHCAVGEKISQSLEPEQSESDDGPGLQYYSFT
ncbi:MAG: hypothetical protein MZV63_43290 [Marinilabiliales bacterium]|nr:hypothetical protein [Marinilabiliales bacterium]